MASTNKKYKGSMSTPAAPGPSGILQTGTGNVKGSMSTPAAPGPTTTVTPQTTPQANNNNKGSLSTQAMGRPIDMSQYMTPDQMKKFTDQANGIFKSSGGGSGSGTGGSGSPGGGSGYNGLTGLSETTAQGMAKSQEGYKPSENVLAAQQALQDLQAQKPQGYESKYGPMLENILQQVLNPDKFNYSLNGDGLFQQYKDQYTQLGKQAMMDTMGQAAALTGGYGNSAAQTVGQQTYDQYMTQLLDKGLDLRDRAYEQYQDEQQRLMDQYGIVRSAEQDEYDRYRDAFGDWLNERDYLTGREDTQYGRDYGQYTDEQSYWLNLAGMENSDANTQAQMAEQKREWDMQYEYNKMSDDRKYAYDICTAILANGKMPSKAALDAAGISEKDAKKMKAQAKTGGSGGGRSGGGGKYYQKGLGDMYYECNADGSLKYDKNGMPITVKEKDLPKNAQIDSEKPIETNLKDTAGGAADIIETAVEQVTGSKPVKAIEEYADRMKKFFGL